MEFKNLAEVEQLTEVPEGASVIAATPEGDIVRVPSGEIQADLTGYATETYVDEAVANVQAVTEITLTETDGVITATHSVAEIYSLLESGREVHAILDNARVPFVGTSMSMSGYIYVTAKGFRTTRTGVYYLEGSAVKGSTDASADTWNMEQLKFLEEGTDNIDIKGFAVTVNASTGVLEVTGQCTDGVHRTAKMAKATDLTALEARVAALEAAATVTTE